MRAGTGSSRRGNGRLACLPLCARMRSTRPSPPSPSPSSFLHKPFKKPPGTDARGAGKGTTQPEVGAGVVLKNLPLCRCALGATAAHCARPLPSLHSNQTLQKSSLKLLARARRSQGGGTLHHTKWCRVGSKEVTAACRAQCVGRCCRSLCPSHLRLFLTGNREL